MVIKGDLQTFSWINTDIHIKSPIFGLRMLEVLKNTDLSSVQVLYITFFTQWNLMDL